MLLLGILVGDAKRLILDAAPREKFIEIHAETDERGDIVAGGRVEAVQLEACALGPWLDADFAGTCVQLGIAPRMKWRPSVQAYEGGEMHDLSYTIAHDEFVRLAEAFGIAVEAGEPAAPERASDEPQDAPESKPPMSRAGLVAAHGQQWPSIEADLNKASTNGLATAAKRGARGWDEAASLEWARSKNKLQSNAPATTAATPFSGLGGKVHRIKG